MKGLYKCQKFKSAVTSFSLLQTTITKAFYCFCVTCHTFVITSSSQIALLTQQLLCFCKLPAFAVDTKTTSCQTDVCFKAECATASALKLQGIRWQPQCSYSQLFLCCRVSSACFLKWFRWWRAAHCSAPSNPPTPNLRPGLMRCERRLLLMFPHQNSSGGGRREGRFVSERSKVDATLPYSPCLSSSNGNSSSWSSLGLEGEACEERLSFSPSDRFVRNPTQWNAFLQKPRGR